MSRNLNQQLQHAISETFREGGKKHEYRIAHNGTDNLTFGVQTNENIRAVAKQFSKYMKENHPEVRMVRDISSEMVDEFLRCKAKNWSIKTCEERLSDMRVIFGKCNRVYGRMHSLDHLTPPIPGHGNIRTVAMTIEDYYKLAKSFINRGTTSIAPTAMQLSHRIGCRINEAAHLRTGAIDLNKGVVHLTEGTKGGKHRDVPIREKDRNFFISLKSIGEDVYVCHGIQAESIDKAIRREMKRIGISNHYERTTDHSIRKLYAKERMEEERKKGLSERQAWEIVQQELGHGRHYRHELYVTYVGC